MAKNVLCIAGLIWIALSTRLLGDVLDRESRERLEFLLLRDVHQVQLHIVAHRGRNAALAGEIARRGGVIRFRADDIDYLRVRNSLNDARAILELAALPDVEAIAVSFSGVNTLLDWPVNGVSASPPLGPEKPGPLLKPYRPIVDLAPGGFQRDNPRFDGRGVVIGMVDGLPDLLHPSLQQATDLQGRLIPKFAIVDYTGNASDDLTDSLWIRRFEEVVAANGRFILGDRSYRAPCDGRYRLGWLPRPKPTVTDNVLLPIAAEPGRDLSRIPILWDEPGGTVWVDTDRDDSFVEEKPLQPFAVRRDVGIFGQDDPATPTRESVPFTVSIDGESRAIRINLAWAFHGTMVLGAMASGYNSGQFDGLAGQAQIAAYQAGSVMDSYNVIETIYHALKDPRVDLLCFECDSRQLSTYELADGKSVFALALDRIAALTRKPLFIPAHNNSALCSVMDYGLGENVICIGAYDSGAALRTNLAAEAPYADNLHVATAFGPGGDGSLKPDLMAPAAHLSTAPLFFNRYLGRLKGYFQLPHAYVIGGGTSNATPTATAAAALLISAAKQSNVRWDGDRIRFALYSTARPLEGIAPYQQGRGLIQLDAAWATLKALDRLPDWIAPRIEVDAPVVTVGAHLLRQPGRGRGIFEREGWRAGDSRSREIVLTRRNGPSTPVAFQLVWQGHAESFRCAPTVTLPLNQPVRLLVGISTATPGVHDAILHFRAAGSPVTALSVLNTVICAEAPHTHPDFVLRRELNVRRPGVESVFFYVPPGTTAVEFVFDKDAPETVESMLWRPDHVLVGIPLLPQKLSIGRSQRVLQNPIPGVWELLLDNRALQGDFYPLEKEPEPRPNPLTPTRVGLELRWLRGATTVSPSGEGQSVRLEVRNEGAALHGRVAEARLGSALRQDETILPGEAKKFPIAIPKGTRRLKLRVDGFAAGEADLTLQLYEVRNGKPSLRRRTRASVSPLVIDVPDPAEGEWLATLDPYRVPDDGARVGYLELVVHDAFGRMEPAKTKFEILGGESWSTMFRPEVLARPTAPRSLVGMVSLAVTRDGEPAVSKRDDNKVFEDVIIPFPP